MCQRHGTCRACQETVLYRTAAQSAWGDGEFLLTRTTFDLNATNYDFIRLRVLAKQGYYIYLNGHLVSSYIWWQHSPLYTPIMPGPNETKWLKKGRNVLAIYSNVDYPECYEPRFRPNIVGKRWARRTRISRAWT